MHDLAGFRLAIFLYFLLILFKNLTCSENFENVGSNEFKGSVYLHSNWASPSNSSGLVQSHNIYPLLRHKCRIDFQLLLPSASLDIHYQEELEAYMVEGCQMETNTLCPHHLPGQHRALSSCLHLSQIPKNISPRRFIL